MCGIFSYFAKESSLEPAAYKILLDGILERGAASLGVCYINKDDLVPTREYINLLPDQQGGSIDNVIARLCNQLSTSVKPGGVVIAHTRAVPETEEPVPVTSTYMQGDDLLYVQPIVHKLNRSITAGGENYLILAHNGSIGEKSYDLLHKRALELNLPCNTRIDSEALLWSYESNGFNMKMCLEDEFLEGAWSFLLLDVLKRRLYMGNSHLPIARGYWKGYGFVYHTYAKTLEKLTRVLRPSSPKLGAVNVWEDFYYHDFGGFIFNEVDLDSGMERTESYMHNFLHPTYVNKSKSALYGNTNGALKKTSIILASGGIDSLAAAVVSKTIVSPDNIILLNINYGHIASQCEHISSKKLAQELNVAYKSVDITNVYKSLCSGNPISMLHDGGPHVTTVEDVKSVVAWVPSRNALFLLLAACMAEHLILNNESDICEIIAGFPNITEETVYPDNSLPFVQHAMQFLKYGTLCGSHNKINIGNYLANFTKTEEIRLLELLGYRHVLNYTCSCDRPIMATDNGVDIATQCAMEYKGILIPACGSGLYRFIAMVRAGINPYMYTKYYHCGVGPTSEADELIPKIPQYVIDIVKSGDFKPVPDVHSMNLDYLKSRLIIH